MKRMIYCCLAAVFMALSGVAAPTITGVTAQQRYPWNGKVDISYTISGDVASYCKNNGLVPSLKVTATDKAANRTYTATKLSGDTALTDGTHKLVWDLDAQGLSIKSDNVVFNVACETTTAATGGGTETYCVIDLSAGPNATSYPVTYLASEPSGGFNVNAYKTTKLVLKRLPAGSFIMGKNQADQSHKVTLSKLFYMGLFEVTQEQWSLVMGSNPSYFSGDALPVEQVSYDMIRGASEGAKWPVSSAVDATSFLGRLQARTKLNFDLPTEAQWEYACRAGTTTSYSYGDSASGDYMWYYPNSSSKTHEVGTKKPNPWGLYDMHGNVNEWCLDWHGTLFYGADPICSDSGAGRVSRGGAWGNLASDCASSFRGDWGGSPSYTAAGFGFRLSRSLSVVTATLFSGNSAAVKIDQTTGSRVAAASEAIRYSTAWETTASGATAVVAVNGTTLKSASGTGSVTWTPTQNGTYTLTHKVMNGSSQVGSTLSATFTVSGKGGPVPPVHEEDFFNGEVVYGEDWLEVVGEESMSASVGEWEEFEAFGVNSGSTIKSVAVSGLPSGLKYNKLTGRVEGRPTKRGVFYVTITATNVNKYSHTLTQVWCVDSDDNGDYDFIGLDDALDISDLDCLYVGDDVEGYCHDIKSASGLPTGLKATVERSSCAGPYLAITGRPTKAGKFKVTFTDNYGRKAVRTLVVRSHGSAYFDVTTMTPSGTCGPDYSGSVKGSGVVSVGSTVKISASPKSGYYFAGWYWNGDNEAPLEEGDKDYRTASQSVVFTWDMANRMADGEFLCARFVTKAQDSSPYLDVESTWYVDTQRSYDYLYFYPESLTLPKITVKGLPAGVKFLSTGGEYRLEAQVSKLKPGTSVATLTLKNASGATCVRTVRVVVPNIESDFFGGLDYADDVYVYHVGQALSGNCHMGKYLFEAAYDGSWSVSASGLPSGVKFVYKYGSGMLEGAPTKAGTYTVTLTAKNGTRVEKATFTVTIDPFPAQYAGTYNGVVRRYDEEEGGCGPDDSYCDLESAAQSMRGLVSATVAANGKVSVKVSRKGKTYSWSGYGYVEEGAFTVDCLSSRDGLVSLTVWDDCAGCRLSGHVELYAEGSYFEFGGQKNVFAEDYEAKMKVTRLNKIGKMTAHGSRNWLTCPMCGYGTPSTSLAITVDAKGVAKAAGKLDGVSVSGTTTVMLRDDGNLYADFVFYNSSMGTIACRIEFDWTWVKQPSVNGMNAIDEGYYEFISRW